MDKQRCTRCNVSKPLSAFALKNGKPRTRCGPCEYARRCEIEDARNRKPTKRAQFDITELLEVWPLGKPVEKQGRVVSFGWQEPA